MKNENKIFCRLFLGFTLAEVLITLGIIGVIAAFLIPSLVKSYQKQVVVTSLQKFNSVMQQAIKLSEADNGQIETWDFPATTSYDGDPANLTVDFLTIYIIPYLKVAQKCDLATTTECWNAVAKPNGASTATLSNTNAKMAKYNLQDGSQIAFISYFGGAIQVLVDINGAKKPNTVGNDVFAFFIVQKQFTNVNAGNGDMGHSINGGGIYPDGYKMDISTESYTYRGCGKDVTYMYAGAFCAAKIINDGWQISSDYPFFN